jgi:curved DNA-binding protein CbpA
MSPDPYDVLGVPREAQAEDLKAAYRRLVRENHPDVASDKVAATARMAGINQAWQQVGDPQKRLEFDARYRLELFERTRHASASPDEAAAPNESPATERSRLEAQRRARLERERLERERARRIRTAGAKTAKSGAKSSKTGSKPVSKAAASALLNAAQAAASHSGTGVAKVAAPKIVKGAERPLSGSREVRLRHKITYAAQLFHRERKVDEALAVCRAVLEIDARSVPARELLGDIYLQQGRVEYALMMFDQALRIAPHNLMLRRKRDQLQSAQNKAVLESKPQTPRASLLSRLRARMSKSRR